MYRLKEKIEYDFETGKWKVPPFLIKAKEVNFPKIKNAMNLVKDELEQRDIVLADTGEILSTGSAGSNKYGRGGIQENFRNGNGNSRARKRDGMNLGDGGSVDSGNGGLNIGEGKRNAPFRNNGSKQNGRSRFEGGDKGFNNDYYASNKGGQEYASSSSSARDAFESHKFGKGSS